MSCWYQNLNYRSVILERELISVQERVCDDPHGTFNLVLLFWSDVLSFMCVA